MNLYHFTTADLVPSIFQTGLRAKPLRFGGREIIGGQRGVWLTERDNLRLTADESEMLFRSSGRRSRYWLHDNMPNIVRLTIRVGDNDQRLIRFNSGEPEFVRVCQWWRLYLRTITPDKINHQIDRVAPSWGVANQRQAA